MDMYTASGLCSSPTQLCTCCMYAKYIATYIHSDINPDECMYVLTKWMMNGQVVSLYNDLANDSSSYNYDTLSYLVSQ